MFLVAFWGKCKRYALEILDKLCIGKNEGGLGFKDLSDFHTAMLEKQLWRLIEKPNCLFSRVLKGWYFRNTSPMEPIRSYSLSYE